MKVWTFRPTMLICKSSGSVVGESPDHVCWVVAVSAAFQKQRRLDSLLRLQMPLKDVEFFFMQ